MNPSDFMSTPQASALDLRSGARDDADGFRAKDFIGEQVLFRPTTSAVMRSHEGDTLVVRSDVAILTGPRKGHAFHDATISDSGIAEALDSIVNNPDFTTVMGEICNDPDAADSPLIGSVGLEADIVRAWEHALALRWDTSTPATEKELLGWNLAQGRKRAGFSQSEAAKEMGWAQPQLSAVESGTRTVSALELREFARLYRTTMARLLP